MTDTSKKPRTWALTGFNLTVGDNNNPIADIRIATLLMSNTVMNGENIKVIEYSAYQSLKEQADKLEKALEKNKSEWEAVNPNGFKHMVAWQIARQALEEYKLWRSEVM